MAVSKGTTKKPRVVEDVEEEESEEVEMESSEEEAEPGDDFEIKEEMPDDFDDTADASVLDISVADIKSEEEEEVLKSNDGVKNKRKKEEEDDADAELSEGEDDKAPTKKKVKKVKKTVQFEESDESSESDGLGDDDDYGADDSDEEDEDDDKKADNAGLANVMAKILGTKKKRGEILTKAKKDYEMKVKKEELEVVDEEGKVKRKAAEEEDGEEEREARMDPHLKALVRKQWMDQFHRKPDFARDYEKEKRLKVMATQGVVQLFGAIEEHKVLLARRMKETQSILERETILENTGKEAFLKVLKRQGATAGTKNTPQPKKAVKEEVKQELKEEVREEVEERRARWNVLSDNFYQEPTLKGWDQQSDDDD